MERRGGRPQESGDIVSELREWRPAIYRKCTDTLWLLLFCLFWAGLMFISGYAVVAGAAERLVLGYDSFGNICGRKNTPVKGANLSGLDMTNKKYVFFLNSCSLEIQSLKSSSLSLCVSSCPQQQLDSLEDLQSFAWNNGSSLCIYNLNVSSYTLNPKATQLCPTLPVPPSKSFPLFNRCVPQNPECYSKYASVLISMVNEMDVFHRILSGILAGRDTVIGLSVLALALSLILVLAFRFIQTLFIHTLIALVVFGLLFGSGVLWWLHYDYRNDPSTELETEKENVKFLLGYAIFSTIVTVVLLSLIFVLRKRLPFSVQLFRIVGKIIGRIPFLLFQPLWTFLILIVFWVFWVAVLLSLGTAGTAQSTSGGQVEYRALSGICYMAWYHFLGLIWTSEFILACQQMVIAGAVVTCYFNRNKNNPPPHPVLSSISVLFCYHLGTAVKGSFLITILRIPRIVLLYLYNILNQKRNAKHQFNCCFCWVCLRYFNQHAYTTTAINGTDFCTSGPNTTANKEKQDKAIHSPESRNEDRDLEKQSTACKVPEKSMPSPMAAGDSGRDPDTPTEPAWISIARQKQRGMHQEKELDREKSVAPDNKSNTEKQNKAKEQTEGPVKQQWSKPSHLAPKTTSEEQRKDTKSEAKPLLRTNSLSHCVPVAPSPALVDKEEISHLKKGSNAAPNQPSWMELAKKKSQAWSDMPQIIK